MPLLPLPSGCTGIDGGILPVSSVADVVAAWPEEFDVEQPSPVLEAIQIGQTALLLAYQNASRYAAAQSDPCRATDEYEDECGEERGCFRQSSESNGAYRARYLARPAVVSPAAIVSAANAILAPYTTTSCRYAEHSDGFFVQDGTATWSAHVFDESQSPTAHTCPNYPDRLYADAAPAGFERLPNRRPPGAMVTGDAYGRWFLLRCPDISLLDTTVAAVFDGGTEETSADGLFVFQSTVATPTAPTEGAFLFNFGAQSVDDIYNAVIGAVNTIVGAGIRWDLVVDPALAP